MKFLKKKYVYLIIISFIITPTLKSDEFDDAIDAETNNAPVDKPVFNQKKVITNEDVISNILTGGVNELLAKNFYLKTHTSLKRPVETLPIFNLYHTDHVYNCWLFNFYLFGNLTERAFFTDSNPFICSFLNLKIFDQFEKIEFKKRSIPKIVELFKNTKKQERRGGLMFQFLKNWDDLSFEFTIPLFYDERNFFFTPREKEDLEDFFGQRTTKEEEREYRKHVISDKLGFGDARVKLGYLITKTEKFCTKAGFQITLPIAFAFKNGLLGLNFDKVTKCGRPTINLRRILQLEADKEDAKVTEFARNFLIDTINWLSAITLNSPMGNGGHFGLGAFAEPQFKIGQGVTFKTLTYIEYFFPAMEKRFFLTRKNPADFTDAALEKAKENPDTAAAEVEFLNNQIIETFFPPTFETDVSPGYMFQITVGPQFKIREWDFMMGYDFWYQHKEHINFINCAKQGNLQLKKALKHHAISNKLFAKLSYNKIKKDHDWSFVVCFEDSLTAKGIGRDFTISAGFEFNY